MKHLPRFFLISSLALGPSIFSLRAQDLTTGDPFVKNSGDAAAKTKDDESWKNCAIVFEAYALEKNDAASVLETERGSTARYRRVLDLAKAGKARLEILTALTTKSGQRAVVESVHEVRYPTEFTPPSTTKGLATPTAWETRNVGDTFEIEPVLNPDGRTCELNLAPQHVSLIGFHDEPELAGSAPVSQPTFSTQKITTTTTVTHGEPHYLGTMTPPTPQGMANGAAASELWLTFLHVSVQGPPSAGAKSPAKLTPEGPVNLEYICYSMDRALAREILVEPASITTTWEKLQVLLGEKKARLEHLSTIKTKSGQRALTEEIQEIRYMAEYAPESRAGSSESTQRTSSKGGNEQKANPNSNDKNPNTNGSVSSSETVHTTRIEANAERIPGFATAFETRNAGATVEVEPVIAPNGLTVNLNHDIQSVKLLGNLKVTGIATQYPPQPLFETSKVTTSQTLPVNQHVLISTMNPPGVDGVNDRVDTGRTWLLFVRATPNEP
jgi:hypothetical protein